MRKTALTGGVIAAAMIMGLAPSVASARPYDRDPPPRHHHHYQQRSCRGSANTGTLVGALGGGLVGNMVTHGGVGGTLIGAGVGGVAGHQIAKSNCRRR